MRTIIYLLFVTVLLTTSCKKRNNSQAVNSGLSETTETIDSNGEIPQAKAERYFVNKSVANQLKTLTITSEEEFNKYFKSIEEVGKATPIDFSSQAVIAVINKESNNDTGINTIALRQLGDKLNLQYRIVTGNELKPFTIRQALILVVDKNHLKDVDFEEVA